jgi:cell division transport system ATP-binding protein
MIKFQNVTKHYGNNKALHGLNLDIHHGEFVSLVGRSGAGKSTLLKLIIGEEGIDGGKILIDDIDISLVRKTDLPYLRRKIGVVFQDIKLLPKRTAFENVAFAMEVCGHKMSKIIEDVPKILDLVGLSRKHDSFPTQMSGGEQQRVAIARALSHRPVLLLADEPTGNLDEFNAQEVLDLLLKLPKSSSSRILISSCSNQICRLNRIEDLRWPTIRSLRISALIQYALWDVPPNVRTKRRNKIFLNGVNTLVTTKLACPAT